MNDVSVRDREWANEFLSLARQRVNVTNCDYGSLYYVKIIDDPEQTFFEFYANRSKNSVGWIDLPSTCSYESMNVFPEGDRVARIFPNHSITLMAEMGVDNWKRHDYSQTNIVTGWLRHFDDVILRARRALSPYVESVRTLVWSDGLGVADHSVIGIYRYSITFDVNFYGVGPRIREAIDG
jgi:hypothetical protein